MADQTPKDTGLSYRDAGVDIDAGNRLVDNIKADVARTARPEQLGGIGGFGGLFRVPAGYQDPVLVSGTDGVGTKLLLAIEMQQFDSIGIDLVAMCVNDILAIGAEPLFFLDYYATGKLDNDIATRVVKGIADGCLQSGAALIGGETAEMPGMYGREDFDLAGFCVGIVEREAIIDGSRVETGDVLVGLTASGPHSNGYSLIRKVIEQNGASLNDPFQNSTLGETLLAPTRIYVRPVLDLLKSVKVRAMAHITGGGLPENLPRVLPEDKQAVIDAGSWQQPEIFHWLQSQGRIADEEMYRTFNCGIGMVLVIPESALDQALQALKASGESPITLGYIAPAEAGKPRVNIR